MMMEQWIPLASIPATGKNIIVDDNEFWMSAFDFFGISCEIKDSVIAEITVFPQDDGVLFRGKIRGTVTLPCDRCSEDSIVTVSQRFDSFEAYPADPYLLQPHQSEEEAAAQEYDENVIRISPQGRTVEINPSALAWQEFVLALPVKPLCMQNCKGLCPVCGCNKNTTDCSCVTEEGDPRLAVLRSLTIKK